MIDDEIETDLECIKNHITLSDSKYQDIKIKTRIEKEFYCKKVSTILTIFIWEIFMRLISVLSFMQIIQQSIHTKFTAI